MKIAIKAAIALPISMAVAISANSAHAAMFYADNVESYTQGMFTYDKPEQTAQRTNVNNALDAPQADATHDFLSLGFGGEVIFSFGGMFSDRVTVWETTWGTKNHQNNYDERVEVFVGNDGEDWLSLGVIENINHGAYDHNQGDGLSNMGATLNIGNDNLYEFVKLVDMSPMVQGRDGFDVNAIAVNIESVPEPTTTLGLLTVGALATASMLKRKQQ